MLEKHALFAEEVLAEFLPLVGLSDFYANLSYRYLNEGTEDELPSHNIRFVNHLRLKHSLRAYLPLRK